MITKKSFKFRQGNANGILVTYFTVAGEAYQKNCTSEYERKLAISVRDVRKPAYLKMQELFMLLKYNGGRLSQSEKNKFVKAARRKEK